MEQTVVDTIFRLLLILALVFANGFFVCAEFSLVTVRKTRVDQLLAEGNRRARSVRRALNDPDSFIAATQLGITMASLGLGWLGEPMLARLIEPAFGFLPERLRLTTSHTVAVAVAFAIITALHIVLGELTPKTIALQYPEKASLLIARPTELFMKLFWPFIALLNGTARAFLTTFGFKPPTGHSLVHSEEELKMLVTASQEAGVLEEGEEQMLHRVFGFADLTAAQIMVPRTELVALPASATLPEVLEHLSRGSHTFLPVYGANLDDILGILHVTDLFRALGTPQEPFGLTGLVREVPTVSETMKADDLLVEMRQRRTRCAIAIDEYGGTAGLVTFEALMERIVGEVGGEFGGSGPRVSVLSDGSALIDGLALVTDVNEQFGLHIDEQSYNTMGGYALGRLGRRARVGDVVEIEGRTARVEALDGLRVARVWLSKPASHG